MSGKSGQPIDAAVFITCCAARPGLDTTSSVKKSLKYLTSPSSWGPGDLRLEREGEREREREGERERATPTPRSYRRRLVRTGEHLSNHPQPPGWHASEPAPLGCIASSTASMSSLVRRAVQLQRLDCTCCASLVLLVTRVLEMLGGVGIPAWCVSGAKLSPAA